MTISAATSKRIGKFVAPEFDADELSSRAILATEPNEKRYLATILKMHREIKDMRGFVARAKRTVKRLSVQVQAKRTPSRYQYCKLHKRRGYGPCQKCETL